MACKKLIKLNTIKLNGLVTSKQLANQQVIFLTSSFVSHTCEKHVEDEPLFATDEPLCVFYCASSRPIVYIVVYIYIYFFFLSYG